jgi:3-methylcrotonyl-CoA carboxylase alpha subunit
MIRSLLIANRGEIACRIIRTARDMGIRTVAVYSDADADALHVREADDAIHIGPSPAQESYLDRAKIIAAAYESGAEAIHPGYGFLSENADFAEAVIAAGLVWIGAPPAAIRAMGLKDAAKTLMAEAGVPVTPGYLGADQSPDRLKAEADAIGYPVLIKAVAGGGGKGMRRVDASADFFDALGSCQREAASSFGDDRVLIEKYVQNPRHIEVQVFGDMQGKVVHLFERDCSLQRRHQKVIEEAPAPGMDPATRAAICDAAIKAARAVDYVGAGTIEFIADASDGLSADRIWFMEMNTRLQVEHPVTEAITGQDLVEWQLRVASGEPLPRRQEELAIDGHAIEARLYAESPATGFLPSTGPLTCLELPEDVRVDSGVEEGDEVTPFYDPMIAKLIVHAPTRAAAAEVLADAIEEVRIWPVKTNAGFLHGLVTAPAFAAAELTTGFIERHLPELLPAVRPSESALKLAAFNLVGEYEEEIGIPAAGAWARLDGFRLNGARSAPVALACYGERYDIDWWQGDDVGGGAPVVDGTFLAVERGETYPIRLYRAEGRVATGSGDGAILAPMPGRIVSVEVEQGASVTAGQRLIVLEAMKMEQALVAPFDGTVETLSAVNGGQITEGALLARVIPPDQGRAP